MVGGGQAGLATGYYLRRTGLSYVILDAGAAPGGAWRRMWPTLRLFSPAQWSSLPGHLMAGGTDSYPTRDEAIGYLADYERRYGLPIERPVRIASIHERDEGLRLAATDGRGWDARAVVSATGTYDSPVIPDIPGRDRFPGAQLHSSEYRHADDFRGQRVLIVGGGNSGAQILAEVSQVAETIWGTLRPPAFLPDHIDGRYLFDQATRRYRARVEGQPLPPPAALGDIVMVPPVRDARTRGVLRARGPVMRFEDAAAVLQSGQHERVDAVIWCTGFAASLGHLRPLGILEADGRVSVEGTRSVRQPRLWLVGYGDWTGYASATLIGVGRSARSTVDEIARTLERA